MILEFMIENNNAYITSKDIAKYLNVSDRTIRSDIKSITDKIPITVMEVISKAGYGYQLKINNFKEFSKIFKECDQSYSENNIIEFENALDRQKYIIRELIFSKNTITLESLLNRLFISDSTLQSDLQKIRMILKKYELILSSDGKDGLLIRGDERELRTLILDQLMDKESVNTSMVLNNITGKISYEKMISIILSVCRRHSIKLSDYQVPNLSMHLLLSIKRVGLGFTINSENLTNIDVLNEKNPAAVEIVEEIFRETEVKLPEEEILYISQYLNKDKSDMQDESFINQIMESVNNIDKILQADLSADEVFTKGLLSHMSSLIDRLSTNKQNPNPILQDLEKNYKSMIDLVELHFENIPLLRSFSVSRNEWAYIAIHFIAALEKIDRNHPIKVLLVCSTGRGTAQMLKVRLRNTFGSLLDIRDEVSFFELNDSVIEDVDLIVSTIDINHLVFSIPTIVVNVLLTDEDKEHLNLFIDQLTFKKSKVLDAGMNKETSTHEVSKLFEETFNENLFIVEEKQMTKDEILQKMINLIKIQEGSLDYDELMNQLNYRETFGSTAFSDDIAVPHPVHEVSDDNYIVVAVCREGILWSKDRQNVNLVILYSPSKLRKNDTELIFETFSSLVFEEDKIANIIAEPNFNRFKKVFTELMEINYTNHSENIV